MEFLLPLIFIMIPVIAKLVEKKIAKGGAAPVAPKQARRTVLDELKEMEIEIEEPVEESVEEPVLKPVPEPVAVPLVAAPEKKPLIKEKEKRTSEKIDPKKLVVYSEIMKPKYMETN